MVQSITVIGGTNAGHLTGLVPVPLDNASPSGFVSSLQALLGSNTKGTGYSDSVNSGALFLSNFNVVGQNGAIAFGANNTAVPGILELTNTDANGSVQSGSASIVGVVPVNYSTLIVQAPGDETISGNGASNMLAIFGKQSSVNYYTNGGSGTVIAGGSGDYVGLTGNPWQFVGSTDGGDTVLASAAGSSVSVYGVGLNTSGYGGIASNVVGIGANNVTVSSYGPNDLVETFNDGTGVISMYGGGNVLVNGGATTVYAMASSTAVNAFFENDGGELVFINQSAAAATVSGGINGAIGGNVTAFGGAGGGVYVGGVAGNNSLVGGTGMVTLYGGGANTYMLAAGTVTGGTNALFANSPGSVTMIGAAGSSNNQFTGSTGSLVVSTNGSGYQNYFVGSTGQESFTGSTVSGAHNTYYFLQDSTGSGADVITNFNFNSDYININPFSNSGGQNTGGVSIAGISQNFGSGGGVELFLSNQTTIKLYGVSLTAADAQTARGGVYGF